MRLIPTRQPKGTQLNMRVPISWLKDYVTITISIEDLAERLTLAGMEVKSLEYIGVAQGVAPQGINVPKSDHLVWGDKIVIGAIREVKPHPNADRLVLAMVDIGGAEPEQIVTGAPNLIEYKEQGALNPPLITAVALEGATVFDGHAEGQVRMILKEKALRGIPNRHMVCSAKELGLPEDDVDGILLYTPSDITAPPGTPLADVLGDVIMEIDLTPNVARCYGLVAVAREVAALTSETLREPDYHNVQTVDIPVENFATITIQNPDLNPRFTATMIRDVEIKPSPFWMQRRLEAVGVRAINNIVDITNYVMFETGQPLHAFDYDTLVGRANGGKPGIYTRTAHPDETLTTLDNIPRKLDDRTVLVCDSAGALSLGGIMGGLESEIQPTTKNVLLEVASWNYINVRRTMTVQKINSEAGLRLSRNVHPALAPRANLRAAEFMRQLSGDNATVARGIIDVYPNPVPMIEIDFPLSALTRLIGITLSADSVIDILTRLQFKVEPREGDVLHITVPDHRTDISGGDIGIADICEEVARIYGHDRIPNTMIADLMPEQQNNESLYDENRVRELLTQAGFRETVNYRLTTPEAEARVNGRTPETGRDLVGESNTYGYVMLQNPIAAERTGMRQTLLNGLLEVAARNQRHHTRQMLFEIGPVFLAETDQTQRKNTDADPRLPLEQTRLTLVITGSRDLFNWQDGAKAAKSAPQMDFFDLKGSLDSLAAGLRIDALEYTQSDHPAFHPGKCAMLSNPKYEFGLGMIGELHPTVAARYGLTGTVIAAEINLSKLVMDAAHADSVRTIRPINELPSVYEDLALIVPDKMPAEQVENAIWKAGGSLLTNVELFDLYRGEQIPEGHKSLAYALTYQAADHTMTESESTKLRNQIIKQLQQMGATIRAG